MRGIACLVVLLLLQGSPALAAKLPASVEEVPVACGYLTEEVAASALGGKVQPIPSHEHISHFYSQCEYKAVGQGRKALRFLFKFMVKEMFDAERLAPEQVDFNAGFAEGGLSYSEKLQYPGELTYIFHDRDLTSILVLTGIDDPPDGAREASTLIFSYRLIDADRTPEQRRDLLMKFAWRHLADLGNSP